jgi:hypothetical protein
VFSTDDFRPMHSLTFGLFSVFRIGPHKRPSGDQPIAKEKPTPEEQLIYELGSGMGVS